MATVGETLKTAREARNLTLEEAAAAVRVQLRFLKMLEEDDLGTMPDESYLLGFLSAYATFLELPGKELCHQLLLQFKELRKTTKAPAKKESKENSALSPAPKPTLEPEPVSPVIAPPPPGPAEGPAASGIKPPELPSLEPKPPAPSTVVSQAVPTILPAPEPAPEAAPQAPKAPSRSGYFILFIVFLAALYFLYPSIKKIFTPQEKIPPVVPAAKEVSPPAPLLTPPPSPVSPPAAISSPTTPPAAPPPPSAPTASPLRLEAKAAEDTWLAVRIDGAADRTSLFLKKGQQAGWGGKERFVVTVGNAGGIELFLNGKSLGKLGKSGDVISDMVITREGRK